MTSEYGSVFTYLKDKSITVEAGNKHYSFDIQKKQENIVLLNVTSKKEIIIYTTDFLEISIFDENIHSFEEDDMFPVELRAGYFTYDKQNDVFPKPVINSRSAYELTAGKYILNIATNEATLDDEFSLVIIEKQ